MLVKQIIGDWLWYQIILFGLSNLLLISSLYFSIRVFEKRSTSFRKNARIARQIENDKSLKTIREIENEVELLINIIEKLEKRQIWLFYAGIIVLVVFIVLLI